MGKAEEPRGSAAPLDPHVTRPDYTAALCEALRRRGVSRTLIERFAGHWTKVPADHQLPCPFCYMEGKVGVLTPIVTTSRGDVVQCSHCRSVVEVDAPRQQQPPL